MGPVIGIDLGTTYSCIAYLCGGRPRIIPNLEGSPTTPSMVAFSATGERLVGTPALRQALVNPRQTLFAVKRLIGRKFKSEEVQKAIPRLPYKLAEAPNGDVLIDLAFETVTPQEVSAIILGYLAKCAESFLGEPVSNAIVTVPAHFGDHQRQATKDAASIAGLNVLRVINEPTAASLAYGLERKRNGKIAVFDMGGGTFDFSLLEINGGVIQVLATNGDSFLGGEDFDGRIMDWLLDEFKLEYKIELASDIHALQRIKESAERAKRELSFTTEAEINLPFLALATGESKHFRKILTRSLLEFLTADLVAKAFPLVEKTLDEARIKPGLVDNVILVGGQTRMPLLRQRVSSFFGKRLSSQVNPDEGVALGAAIQSGIIDGDMEDIVLLLDVTSLALGIETKDGGYEKIIEKNTTIPTRKTKAFTTVEDNQRQVRIHVLQGDNPLAADNVSLAVFDLIGIIPAPIGVPQIDVSFEIDADGLVKVSAKDTASGKTQKITVHPSSGLSKERLYSAAQKERDRKKKDRQHGQT